MACCSRWPLYLLFLVMCDCEWIQVPLRTRDLEFGDSFPVELPARISDKLESLAIALRSDSNRTKQMDMELDRPTTTRRRFERPVEDDDREHETPTAKPKRRKDSKVTKKNISEPFSIFSFLRSVRDSFFFRSQASVKQKVGFLERIRDNIMAEIKRRLLGSLFPVMRQQRLAKRDLESHEHGHDFVSADGALVTICFLTFSVFLIKLVLQIIYILKKKHYNMTPGGEGGTVGAVRRLVKKNQNARTIDPEEDDDDAQKYMDVMRAINKTQN